MFVRKKVIKNYNYICLNLLSNLIIFEKHYFKNIFIYNKLFLKNIYKRIRFINFGLVDIFLQNISC